MLLFVAEACPALRSPGLRQNSSRGPVAAVGIRHEVSPAAGANPSGDLLGAQTRLAGELLRLEIEEMDPAAVVVLSGRDWFAPFAESVPARVAWREGLVEGVGEICGRPLVVAKHPMGKPEAKLVELALAGLRAERPDAQG